MINRRSFLASAFAGLFVLATATPSLAAMRKVKLKVPGFG